MVFVLKVAKFYSEKISAQFNAPKHAGKPAETNSVGTAVSFVCGAFVRFYLVIDGRAKEIRKAKYKTDGCGFTVAAAEVLAETLRGRKLIELHGLHHSELQNQIEAALGKFPQSRRHCAEICFDALHQAFADFRAFQIEEFAGEEALICTCFGVSEKTIEKIISERQPESVEEVGEICRAGRGCGSCQMLIQEMIDAYGRENW